MEPRQDLLRHAVESYLHQSHLSLSALAGKLDISKSHLSDIKNGKAKAGLDLGLKILKRCGADLNMRREWLDEYMKEEVPEYSDLQQTAVADSSSSKLSQEFCQRLETNSTLMHIILDVMEQGELGLARSDILTRYGQAGIEFAESLVEAGLVVSRLERYYASDQRLQLSRKSSYSFVENTLREQREKYLAGQYEGRFEFQVDDVTEVAMEELFQLHQDYMKRAAEIVKKVRHQDGAKKCKRVMVQAMTSVLRNNLVVMVMGALLTFFSLSDAIADGGGLGGGSNSAGVKALRMMGFPTELRAIEAGGDIEAVIETAQYQPAIKAGHERCQNLPGYKVLDQVRLNKYTVDRYFKDRQQLYELTLYLEVFCRDTRENGWAKQ